MAREKVDYETDFEAVMNALTRHGLLLGSYDASGKPNVMTIGWGTIGSVWGIPIWTVLVRPTRYTYQCIEHTGCFTVNVPPVALGMACATCGSTSGRDTDKFADTGLTPEKAEFVLAPTVAECPIVYECQVVHSNDLLPTKLADEIMAGHYVDGNFHRVYWGKILSTTASPNAAELLK